MVADVFVSGKPICNPYCKPACLDYEYEISLSSVPLPNKNAANDLETILGYTATEIQ